MKKGYNREQVDRLISEHEYDRSKQEEEKQQQIIKYFFHHVD